MACDSSYEGGDAMYWGGPRSASSGGAEGRMRRVVLHVVLGDTSGALVLLLLGGDTGIMWPWPRPWLRSLPAPDDTDEWQPKAWPEHWHKQLGQSVDTPATLVFHWRQVWQQAVQLARWWEQDAAVECEGQWHETRESSWWHDSVLHEPTPPGTEYRSEPPLPHWLRPCTWPHVVPCWQGEMGPRGSVERRECSSHPASLLPVRYTGVCFSASTLTSSSPATRAHVTLQ